MQTITSVTEYRRRLSEDADKQLFPYLNAHSLGVGEIARIDRLLELLVTAEEKRARLQRLTEGWVLNAPSRISYDENLPSFLSRITFNDPNMQRLKSEYDATLLEVNQLFERFRWTSLVQSMDFSALSILQTWPGLDLCRNDGMFPAVADILKFIPESGMEVIARRASTGDPAQQQRWSNWEHWSALWLIARIKDDTIRHFKRCQNCGRWFFAVLKRQKFCVETCRKQEFSQSEKHKDNRRRYMVEYRKREKERIRRTLELARSNYGKKR
jgi:hypothetical protein